MWIRLYRVELGIMVEYGRVIIHERNPGFAAEVRKLTAIVHVGFPIGKFGVEITNPVTPFP